MQMRRLLAPLALAALALPAPAFSKELVSLSVCGTNGCHTTRDKGDLRASGSGPVGAFGMSLGGYAVALLASVEPALAFAVPMIPIVSFTERLWAMGEDDPWLKLAIENGWTRRSVRALLRVHEPLSRPALVPHARRLVIGARGDAICTPAHAEALWRHWQRPRIHWYPGGHLLQFRRGVAMAAVRALIEDAGLLPQADSQVSDLGDVGSLAS